ncbi:hypothetical protein [Pseudooceanicola nanhaiensis]|uniref:hypothetical protein n=1 Tax=Pseudooceanicola nanhaiensis TaxID=375761 RepID=UPI004057EB73
MSQDDPKVDGRDEVPRLPTRVDVVRTVVGKFVDLHHENPYISYMKSTIWAAMATLLVCAVVRSITFAIALIFSGAEGADEMFYVNLFNTLATVVSLFSLVTIMILEFFQLAKRLSVGSGGND